MEGAITSSPAVVGGTVYIGSDNRSVYALDETSGAVRWHHALNGPVTASPAVDAANGLLVVGDASGTVTALATSDGAPRWSFATGGPIRASALLDGGRVYIGSADHRFYALTEKTGTKAWSFSTGRPITASAAVVPGGNEDVVVGSGDGLSYYLDPSTGALVYEVKVNPGVSGVVGVAASSGFTVAEDAAGDIVGSKPQASDPNAWRVVSSRPLASTPTVVNGEVFVTGENGMVVCYTIPGNAPV